MSLRDEIKDEIADTLERFQSEYVCMVDSDKEYPKLVAEFSEYKLDEILQLVYKSLLEKLPINGMTIPAESLIAAWIKENNIKEES